MVFHLIADPAVLVGESERLARLGIEVSDVVVRGKYSTPLL